MKKKVCEEMVTAFSSATLKTVDRSQYDSSAV